MRRALPALACLILEGMSLMGVHGQFGGVCDQFVKMRLSRLCLGKGIFVIVLVCESVERGVLEMILVPRIRRIRIVLWNAFNFGRQALVVSVQLSLLQFGTEFAMVSVRTSEADVGWLLVSTVLLPVTVCVCVCVCVSCG